MLSQLHIENVAVIERADLNLETGFNVLTGETGAGKSILIDSINLVLGERVSKDIVRSGSNSAQVTALFAGVSEEVRNRLSEMGYSCEEDGSLLISREISADGRSSCRISGRPATVSIVREVGRMLINIHGQHDNQTLLSPEKHIVYLDRFAGIEQELSEYSQYYREWVRLQKELNKLKIDDAEKARRIDLLNYQINEIESAALVPGEDEELEARKAMIQNAGRIAQAVGEAYSSLDGGDSVPGAQELLSGAADQLNTITDVYPEIASLAARLTSLSYELDDCMSDLRGFAGEREYVEDDIDEIEQRIDTVYRMKLKYGGSIPEVLSYLDRAQNELESIEGSEETVQKLNTMSAAAYVKAKHSAEVISKKRRFAAAQMEREIEEELAFLEMPNVRFKAQFTQLGELTSNGAESVEFLISANPGSPLRPLARIASGGEISRVMLAIKKVLAGNDEIETLIFDEIDTGVSGRAAQKIGLKLREVAKNRQVVCVTHLAQIASQADRHILIEKQVESGKTYTHLQTLDYSGRTKELARIIGGANITQITLQNAGEMLEQAGIRAESIGG